ncbi:glycoside hydrolase family 3 protein [Polluticaenibacter yanchengensis]|uniref:beta-N-acetylhexosaminidase n=1 Tax=Polluticaenibacter yanchengensis TaxID=3014562 RepID=A0ABT4UJS3_9BACT|nr:hypothetical protein [Chitinophagaceae bacterium LY-5]
MRLITIYLLTIIFSIQAVRAQKPEAIKWADSVLQSLTLKERVAQLMVVRSSQPNAMLDKHIDSLVEKYNIGAICAFQGTPLQHATMFNRIQEKAKTPIMVTVDGEWGLGMRFTGVNNLPYQLTMGALPNAGQVYRAGEIIARQCRRMNIHVNYAPVVDINNNPNNPVIGLRSFGEDKYKVALFGTRIMEGMQDNHIMACAKHFPGHGDVAVDSHYDLPVIKKTKEQLDSLELYPFKQLIAHGVQSVMVAHLSIPAIDTTPNRPTSLSPANINGLLRKDLGFAGLTFTDALEMKGVSKFFPSGEAAVQSLIAGNDMLCLPEDVPASINAVLNAIDSGLISETYLNEKCRKVLLAKYEYVKDYVEPVFITDLLKDLNAEVDTFRAAVAEKSLTVLAMPETFSFLQKQDSLKTVYINLGAKANSTISASFADTYNIDIIDLPFTNSSAIDNFNVKQLQKYDRVVVALHGVTRSTAKNFGIPASAIKLIKAIDKTGKPTLNMVFGNPYIIAQLDSVKGLVACYEDDVMFRENAYKWLTGSFDASGTLPVTIGKYPFGSGIVKKKS